jgi:hypothetical protein
MCSVVDDEEDDEDDDDGYTRPSPLLSSLPTSFLSQRVCISKDHFTHETWSPWWLRFKISHWLNRLRPSEFIHTRRWRSTKGPKKCLWMTSLRAFLHGMDDVSLFVGVCSRPTSKRYAWCKFRWTVWESRALDNWYGLWVRVDIPHNCMVMALGSCVKWPWGAWPYCEHFQLHRQYWPLDWIGICLILLMVVLIIYVCVLLFQCFEVVGVEMYKSYERSNCHYIFSLKWIHKFSIYIDYETHDGVHFGTHDPITLWHMFVYLLFKKKYALKYKPCHIVRLKQMCLMKKSGHVYKVYKCYLLIFHVLDPYSWLVCG